ncbi:unnamed protein product [Trifolium pratense]|uniref:Uncharacterized protein n=1 Tax=Trifolium pratense TaxID=57577 RepID=A0ACB0L982_TRIPR|nr:unnamed protein product [Trifolium pratense]
MSKPNPILQPLLHALDPISLILNQNSNSNQPCPLTLVTEEDSFIMERGRNYNAYAELREKRLRMRCLMHVQEENFEIESTKLVDPSRKLVKFEDDLGYGKKGSLEKEESFEIESQKIVAPIRKNVNFQGGFGYGRKGSLEHVENFEIETQKLVTSTRKEVRFQGGFGYGRKGSLEQEERFEIEQQKFVSSTRKEVKFQGGLANGRKGSFVVAQSVPDFSAVLRKENRKPSNYLPPVMEMMTPPSKSSFSKDYNEVVSSSRGSKSDSAGEKKKKTVGGGGCGGVLTGRKSYASFDELRNLSSATAIAINGESRGRGGNGRVLRKSISVHRQF